MPRRVVVIGGGIAGLSVAHRLLQSDPSLKLTLLEREARCGGKIQSVRQNGCLLEAGPNGFLDNEPASLALVDELGMGDRLLRSRDAARARFLVRDGAFHKIEMNPRLFLKSPLLSRRAKMRMAMEYFIKPRRDEADESVASFGRRRLGREFTDIFLDSMVSGVYAGNVETLSLHAAFPGMPVMERQYGGLFRALRAKQKERKAAAPSGKGPAGPMGGVLHSFREGMQEIVDELRRRLQSRVMTDSEVRALEQVDGSWRVRRVGDALEADAVVLATPAHDSVRLLASCAPDSARAMESIDFSGIHVVYTVHRREDCAHPVDGFGALIPRREGRRLLGSIWTHAVFDDQAPDDVVLLRHMVGGAHDPQANQLDDGELSDLVLREADELYGLRKDPLALHLFRWPLGIPQYTVGHLDRVRKAREALPRGLFLAGNSVAGIGFNHCVAHAERLAPEILESLARAEVEAAR